MDYSSGRQKLLRSIVDLGKFDDYIGGIFISMRNETDLNDYIANNIKWLVMIGAYIPDGAYSCNMHEFTIEKGKLHGTFKSFYNDGKCWELFNYEYGHLNGECFRYYNNGNPYCVYNYVNGKLEGDCNTFYESGKIHIKSHKNDDKSDGFVLIYKEEGQLLTITNHKNGKRVYYSAFGENGLEYENYERKGFILTKKYNIDGSSICEIIKYNDGKNVQKVKKYDKDCKIIKPLTTSR